MFNDMLHVWYMFSFLSVATIIEDAVPTFRDWRSSMCSSQGSWSATVAAAALEYLRAQRLTLYFVIDVLGVVSRAKPVHVQGLCCRVAAVLSTAAGTRLSF